MASDDPEDLSEPMDDLTRALCRVRLRLGAAEDGLDRAIIALRNTPHMSTAWRQEFEHDLGALRTRIDTFRTLMNGR